MFSSKVHPACHNIANGIEPGSNSKTTDTHAAECSKNVCCNAVFQFCKHYVEEERTGCFTLIVLLLLCGCLCLVFCTSSSRCRVFVCDCLIIVGENIDNFADLFSVIHRFTEKNISC